MQGNKSIRIIFQVDPVLYLLLEVAIQRIVRQLSLTQLKDNLQALEGVIKSALVQQSLAILIHNVADSDVRLLAQVGLELNLIVFLDELRAFTEYFSQLGFHLAGLLHFFHLLMVKSIFKYLCSKLFENGSYW